MVELRGKLGFEHTTFRVPEYFNPILILKQNLGDVAMHDSGNVDKTLQSLNDDESFITKVCRLWDFNFVKDLRCLLITFTNTWIFQTVVSLTCGLERYKDIYECNIFVKQSL